MKQNKLAFAVITALFGIPFLYAEEKVVDKKSEDLSTIVVVGETPNIIDATLENVDSMSGDSLDNPSVVDFSTALGKETSVTLDMDGSGNSRYFNIRGLGKNYSEVTIDGIKMPEWFDYVGFYKTGEMGNFEIDTIKQVDIVKGRHSPKQSGGALAGSVNMRTYRPSDFVSAENTMYGSVKSGYTSNNRGFANTVTGALKKNDFSAMLMYTHRDFHERENMGNDDEQSKHNNIDFRQDNILAKGQFDLQNGKVIITGEHFSLKRETEKRYSKSTAIVEPTKKNRLGVELELDNAWGFDSLKSRAQFSKYTNRNGFYSGYSKQFKIGNFKQNYFDMGFDGVKTFGTESLNHNVLLGIGYNRAKFDFKVEPERSPTYRPNPITIRQTYYAYVKDNMTFANGVVISPGLRIEHKKQSSQLDDLYLANPATTFQGFIPAENKTTLTPSIGLVVPIKDSTKLFATYAQGSKSADETNFSGYDHGFMVIIPNPSLKDEQSKTFELGLKHQFTNTSSIKVNAFYNKYDNFISNATVPNYQGSGRGAYMPVNLDKVKTYGLEVNANFELSDAINAYLGATWIKGKQSSGDTESNMTNSAPLVASVGLKYNQENVWGTDINIRLSQKGVQKDAEIDGADRYEYFQTPGYGVVNFSAWWKPVKGMKITGSINNVLDKKYWLASDANASMSSYSGPYGNRVYNLDSSTQPGRNFAINVKYEF